MNPELKRLVFRFHAGLSRLVKRPVDKTRHPDYRPVPELVFPTGVTYLKLQPMRVNRTNRDRPVPRRRYDIGLGDVSIYHEPYHLTFRLETDAGTLYHACPSYADSRSDADIIKQLVLNHFQESRDRLRLLRYHEKHDRWMYADYHRQCDELVALSGWIQELERMRHIGVTWSDT